MRQAVLWGLVFALTGCGIHGTYSDPTDQDAAKLRFVSKLTSATLTYVGDKNCTAYTTGMLNNPLIPNSDRRVGMLSPPPSGINYLEIKLKAGKPAYFKANMGGDTMYTAPFTFVPKPGVEYEATYTGQSYYVTITLEELEQENGVTLRQKIPFSTEQPEACKKANSFF